MIRLGVFGNPIQHSLSPGIHRLFAEQRSDNIQYERYLTTPGQFRHRIAAFFRDGGAGANVTLPFKEHAAALCTQLTERARLAGAVNTLIPQELGGLIGDNTDGEGLVIDLKNKGYKVSGCSLVVYGAGGSARGILPILLQQRPACVHLVNRTVSKAERLKADLLALGVAEEKTITVCESAEFITTPVDLLINATSSSLTGQSLPLPPHLSDGACGYDLMYAPEATVFLRQLQAAGCQQCSDGFGMLVEQAASSYQRWMGGDRPTTASVIQQLSPGI